MLIRADSTKTLPLADASIQCVVTSPPYWGLRDYGVPGQIGLETTFGHYIERMVNVFREVWRVLRPDGVVWLNVGDAYCAAPSGPDIRTCGLEGGRSNMTARRQASRVKNAASKQASNRAGDFNGPHRAIMKARRRPSLSNNGRRVPAGWSNRNTETRIGSVDGLKPKDLIGMPWRVALALQADGWWLRSDIVWNKPNPMPESVTDRPTRSHEYIFLLTKSARYYYDADAIKEECSKNTHARIAQPDLLRQGGGWKQEAYQENLPGKKSRDRKPADILRAMSAKAGANPKAKLNATGSKQNESFSTAISGGRVLSRNKRTVWTISTAPCAEAHFATFPEKLVEPCVLAGSRIGDAVLDPFSGSGTVERVAARLGRKGIGIELNPSYIEIAKKLAREPRRAQLEIA